MSDRKLHALPVVDQGRWLVWSRGSTSSATLFIDKPYVAVTLVSPEETEALGRRLGMLLKPGIFVALRGELGGGKTCFTRGSCCSAQLPPVSDMVASPTFAIMNEYPGTPPCTISISIDCRHQARLRSSVSKTISVATASVSSSGRNGWARCCHRMIALRCPSRMPVGMTAPFPLQRPEQHRKSFWNGLPEQLLAEIKIL